MPQNYVLEGKLLHTFLCALRQKAELVVPVERQDGAVAFAQYAGEVCLDSNPVFPAKKYFLKPRDRVLEFTAGGAVKETIEAKKRIIFGLRPCGLHALNALDELFIHNYYTDPYYAARRKNTLLIGLQCTKPGKNCFCNAMETGNAIGFDLLLTPKNNNYYVEVGTGCGEKLINKLFKKTNLSKPRIKLNFKKKFNAKGIGELLMQNTKHRVWKNEAARCLSCTACTQVCPTCYCFSIEDEFDLKSSKSSRFRCSNSCQLKNFTTVAGGHVFRETRASRLRQFVNHNLSYYWEQHGVHKCVGCGRCINECPVDIDLTKIAGTIRGGRNG